MTKLLTKPSSSSPTKSGKSTAATPQQSSQLPSLSPLPLPPAQLLLLKTVKLLKFLPSREVGAVEAEAFGEVGAVEVTTEAPTIKIKTRITTTKIKTIITQIIVKTNNNKVLNLTRGAPKPVRMSLRQPVPATGRKGKMRLIVVTH